MGPVARDSLRELRLASNDIEEDGAAELQLALSSCQLALLDLRGNRIGAKSETFAALADDARANVNFQLWCPPRAPRAPRESRESQ